jgi:hypothetical protein
MIESVIGVSYHCFVIDFEICFVNPFVPTWIWIDFEIALIVIENVSAVGFESVFLIDF